MALCASFFRLYGRHEHSAGWPWALVTFGIWAVINFVLRGGIGWQVLGQIGLFAALTVWDMVPAHKARS